MQLQLHSASGKPEWDGVADPNTWQRLAAKTNGFLTPANIISFVGLGLSVWGLLSVTGQHVIFGSILVTTGRLFDILDGIVAQATHTKSPLGAFIDATADKILVLFAFFVLVLGHVMPWWVAALILLANIVNAGLSVLTKRRGINPYPSKAGKLSMMYAWLVFGGFIYEHALHAHHTAAQIFLIMAYVYLGIFLVYEVLAFKEYWARAFGKKVTHSK